MAVTGFSGEALTDWWRGQRLIAKFATILAASGVVFIPLIYLALQMMLAPTFSRIEEKAVNDQARRAQHSLQVYRDNLTNSLRDYAIWDGSYTYLANPSPAFIADTLSPIAYENMGLDVTGYVTNDRKVLFSNAVDRGKRAILADETAFFALYFSGRFFDEAQSRGRHADLVKTSRGLFLLDAMHVVHSDESGPSRGIMAMGILLDSRTLSDALQVDVKLDIAPTPAEVAMIAGKPRLTAVTTFDDHRVTRIGLADASGRIVGIIEYNVPRNASMVGRRAILLATLGMSAMMLLLILIVSWSIRRIAVRRLHRLELQVTRMRQGDFDITDDLVQGNDEISRLAQQFVRLDEDLESANNELRRASYLQGKADSAAGMLHNVRNGLAPLRVVQERWLAEEHREFRLNMERAAAELAGKDCPADRRAALRDFLVSAALDIAAGGAGRRAEMVEAKSTVDQIAAILGSYDFDTSGRRAQDVFDPMTVIRQEVRVLDDARFGAIRVVLPAAAPLATGNRVQLGQVLANVLVNAGEAIRSAGPEAPEIRIAASHDAEGAVTITVTDNGDGIAPDKLAATFERGYSTRKHKSGGLGMHWSSIAMQSMGGNLKIASDGVGCGATVTITLPGAETGSHQALAA